MVMPPLYKGLPHRVGPPEQSQHSQPRLGWRDCRGNRTTPHCVALFDQGGLEARPFSPWIFQEQSFWIRRLFPVWVTWAPSHQSEAQSVSNSPHDSFTCVHVLVEVVHEGQGAF